MFVVFGPKQTRLFHRASGKAIARPLEQRRGVSPAPHACRHGRAGRGAGGRPAAVGTLLRCRRVCPRRSATFVLGFKGRRTAHFPPFLIPSTRPAGFLGEVESGRKRLEGGRGRLTAQGRAKETATLARTVCAAALLDRTAESFLKEGLPFELTLNHFNHSVRLSSRRCVVISSTFWVLRVIWWISSATRSGETFAVLKHSRLSEQEAFRTSPAGQTVR